MRSLLVAFYEKTNGRLPRRLRRRSFLTKLTCKSSSIGIYNSTFGLYLRCWFLIVFHSGKMDLPELPQRIFTLGEDPFSMKSIVYHTDDSKLLLSVRQALHDDKYEELKDSKLGLFIKFKELNFSWTSRLVHYMVCFQLNIKKKYELCGLVGPQTMRFSLIKSLNTSMVSTAITLRTWKIQGVRLQTRWLLSGR